MRRLVRVSGTRIVPGHGRQVLLLSMRRLADLVACCILYEFEDVIASLTGADRVEAGDRSALEFSRRAFKLVRLASGSQSLARRIAPRPSSVQLDRDYELFFPVFNDPHELYALATISNWRERSRVAICYISEVWAHLLPKYLLELLGQFDHVFLGMRHPVEDVTRICNRPCSYLPLAADVIRFSPGPNPPQRAIDVCNIGRRSPTTHEALIALAAERKIFYYFDTFAGGTGKFENQRTFRVERADRHRLLLANLLQRSRYYVANRCRANEPEYTGEHEEISGRFYEGAAAGTVMLGEPPNTAEFRRQFGWPDAVIRIPFDCSSIGRTLSDLNQDPERLARIQRDNMSNACLQHDWVHRLRTVFTTAGIAPTPAMLEREHLLRQLAEQVNDTAAAPVSVKLRSAAE